MRRSLLAGVLAVLSFTLVAANSCGPTQLEVEFHHGCNGPVTYLECLAGGRQNSPGSQFVTVERHRSYAGLTPDDLQEIRAAGWNYLCDRPQLCIS